MLNTEMVSEMAETLVAKRKLGNGRWDKVLKQRLTELSNADNYEEAKEEWVATGQVWWGNDDAAPDWVTNSQMGRGKCLCGHPVVYHFEIVNTENGVVECVGSDHINTYLIMKAIAEDKGIPIDAITDAQIQEWINVRVASMKAEAWWAENGESFKMMFNKVKEIDLHFNVHTTNTTYWCNETERYRYVTKIRKVGSGEFGTRFFKMASVVWRWNHPNNPKNQQTTRGYPNDLLMRDLSYLFVMSNQKIAEYEKYKTEIEERKQEVIEKRERLRVIREQRQAEQRERERLRREQWERDRPAREAAQEIYKLKMKKKREEEAKRQAEREKIRAIENARFLSANNHTFENMCGYYGIPAFNESFASNAWETNFLADIKMKLTEERELTINQINKLRKILDQDSATEKQIAYLKDLGYEDDFDKLTKRQASWEINRLKRQQDD